MQYNMKRIDNDAVVWFASRFCWFLQLFGQPSLGLNSGLGLLIFPEINWFFGLVAPIGFWLGAFDSRWRVDWFYCCFIALAMQAYMVLPYTFCGRNKVQTAKPKSTRLSVKLLVANVLTTNPNKQALIDLIHTHQPDIVLTLETDQALARRFKPNRSWLSI